MDAEAARYIAAGLCMWLWAIWPAIWEWLIASKAMEAMGRNPQVSKSMFSNMLIAMAVTESTGIYSLLVAFVILFV